MYVSLNSISGSNCAGYDVSAPSNCAQTIGRSKTSPVSGSFKYVIVYEATLPVSR